VSGTVILPPKPAGPHADDPPAVPTASDPAGAPIQPMAIRPPASCSQAVNTYNAQATVFNEAKAIVPQRRGTFERNAH